MISIRAKDYVLAKGDLFFAVVSDVTEQDRVLTWLRYRKDEQGLCKLTTAEADAYIRKHYPYLIFHSDNADIELHGVPLDDIAHVLKPRQGVHHLLALDAPDAKQADAIHIIKLLIKHGIEASCLGITGSLLLAAQHDESDIDVVVYGREAFFRVRAIIAGLVETGELKSLQLSDWREAYDRRACSLGFDDYCLHERRKMNKCLSGSSKVDITMLPDAAEQLDSSESYKKTHHETLTARVVDDRYAYDFPARFVIDHDRVDEVLVTTATYTGQAMTGEMIEASGILELSPTGRQRLVVGTSREAQGEYLKVIESEQLY